MTLEASLRLRCIGPGTLDTRVSVFTIPNVSKSASGEARAATISGRRGSGVMVVRAPGVVHAATVAGAAKAARTASGVR